MSVLTYVNWCWKEGIIQELQGRFCRVDIILSGCICPEFSFIQIYLIGHSQPWQKLKKKQWLLSQEFHCHQTAVFGLLADRSSPWGLPFLQLVSAFCLDCCVLGQWWRWETEERIRRVEAHCRRNWQSWFNNYWKSVKKRLTECFVCSINIYQVTNMYHE